MGQLIHCHTHTPTDTQKQCFGTNLGSTYPEAKHHPARYDPHNKFPQNNFTEANYRFRELERSQELFLKEKRKKNQVTNKITKTY